MPYFDAPDNVEKLRTEVTAYYGLQLPSAPSEALPALLLAIHGWGQNAPRFLRDFDVLRAHNVVVAAPQGLHQFYLDPGTKKVGFNWLTAYDRQQAIDDTNRFLAKLLDTIEERHPFDRSKVFLLGFSQGSAMAWRFAVSDWLVPAGLISIGADLPEDVAARLGEAAPFPSLLLRGADDPLAGPALHEHAESTLRGQDWAVTAETYPGEHRITAEAVMRMVQWMGVATP